MPRFLITDSSPPPLSRLYTQEDPPYLFLFHSSQRDTEVKQVQKHVPPRLRRRSTCRVDTEVYQVPSKQVWLFSELRVQTDVCFVKYKEHFFYLFHAFREWYKLQNTEPKTL